MSNEELADYNRRRPFRPYLLEFVSGIQVRIENRESIAFFNPFWLYRGPRRAQALFPVPRYVVCWTSFPTHDVHYFMTDRDLLAWFKRQLDDADQKPKPNPVEIDTLRLLRDAIVKEVNRAKPKRKPRTAAGQA